MPNTGPAAAPTAVQRLHLTRGPHATSTPYGALRPDQPAVPEGVDRDALFAEFGPLVDRLVRQFGDDREGRRDLISEIYWRFAAYLEAYDPTRGVPLRAYLVNNLTTSAFNYARSCRTRRGREQSLEAQPVGFAARHAHDPTPEWDNALMAERIKSSLSAGLERLSERQRRVVIWRYWDDLPYAEIARRLEIQEATARSTLRKALLNLRQWAMQGGLGA